MPENNEKEPQYKSILSDDDGTAPRPIRKKQRDDIELGLLFLSRSSSASSAKRRSC